MMPASHRVFTTAEKTYREAFFSTIPTPHSSSLEPLNAESSVFDSGENVSRWLFEHVQSRNIRHAFFRHGRHLSVINISCLFDGFVQC